VPFAARIRKEVGIKTWAVGLITEPEQAEHIVAAGQADCTVHARPFLLDPRWAWNAARALGVEPPSLPLPAARASTILPFKPQPALARAAD
jgi:NADPH2 dehydrogenase